MVVWYDSILATSGELRHQNALTRDNYEFFHFTDAFFTNYWWNPSSLQATAQLRGTNQRRVYVGNDCFGRGTFGGGRLEIYKGANPILEFKGQLGIGLFAPGFTYEEGRGVRALFHIMENSLYKGINTQFLEMEKWKEKKRDQTNGGWEKQGN
jgi:endo-beta-N-acetylglucosaminidase D